MHHIHLFKIKYDILWQEFIPAPAKQMSEKILQVVLPEPLRKVIVEQYQDRANHFAFQKTYLNIRKRYYWPGMAKEIKEYCKGCITCVTTKNCKLLHAHC